MKVVLCIDQNETPVWVAFPTTTEEIRTALKGRGLTVIDDDEIQYEFHDSDSLPDISDIVPFWMRSEFSKPEPSAVLA